jgi:hypothetical protein
MILFSITKLINIIYNKFNLNLDENESVISDVNTLKEIEKGGKIKIKCSIN